MDTNIKVADDFVCTCDAFCSMDCICLWEYEEEEMNEPEEQQCPNCKHWNTLPVALHECRKCQHMLD